MSDGGSSVMRGATKTPHGNTVTYRTVVIYFQWYPGTEAASGIADEEYVLKIGSKQVKGRLSAQGSVVLRLPAGSSGVLEIFGSRYEINVRGTIEALDTDRGVQRRLSMLGYELGNVDGIVGAKTDRAILNFQADNNPLAIDGIAGAKTQKQLKAKAGE